jgi:hypothetical protein
MIPSGTVEFTLTDWQGKTHTYQTHLFTPSDGGLDIMWQITALGAEPLGRIVDGVTSGAGMVSAMMAGGGLDKAVEIDFSGLGADVAKALMVLDAGAFSRRIMSRTLRDGKRLDDDSTFDGAYRGNYWEFQRACWEVVKVNRFFPSLATSPDLAAAAANATTA